MSKGKNGQSVKLDRRQFIAGIGAICGGAVGSAIRPRTASANQASDRCNAGIVGPGTNKPLMIDIHCHVFNGYDIPVRDFLQKIVLNSDEAGDLGKIGGFSATTLLLTILARRVSDTTEISKLDRLFQMNNPSQAACTWYGSRQNGTERDLPPTKLVQDFARFYKQHRAFNAFDLMTFYPDVHLFTPAIVDLFMGVGPAKAVYPNQLAIAERISRLTQGRMHFFAAFDPMRQVLHDRNPAAGYMNQLALVQDAVENRGFIGVKLYPPMGFAPVNNESLACPPIKKGLFGQSESAAMFRSKNGAELDRVLESLFSWAETKHVPIMAHAAASNFSNAGCALDDPTTPASDESRLFNDEDFDKRGYYLGNADQWEKLLAKHGELRLNLAHYDHQDVQLLRGKAEPTEAIRGLNALVYKYKNVYLDLSHFDALNRTATREGLGPFLTKEMEGVGNVLAHRLMYGSDWHMLARTFQFENYVSFMNQGIPKAIAVDFFGKNAANFLGLLDHDGTRGRLESFYQKHSIAPPVWMQMLG